MTHRERVLAAFAHRQPDCVPIDLGGTRVSSIVAEGYTKLLESCGIAAGSAPVLSDRMMRSVHVDERLQEHLDIDTRLVMPKGPTRSPVVELGSNRYRDAWGVERVHKPGTYYYEQEMFPLAGDISIQDLKSYPWPEANDPGMAEGLRERLAWVRENTDCAAVLMLPAPFVHYSQYLRGFEDWYMDFHLNPGLLEALFDRILEITMVWARLGLEAVGRDVDVIICSDDMGAQNGLQVSHEHFTRFFRPRLEKYFRQIHEMSTAPLALHSCGSVASIIDDLIEIGIKGINPVQVTAAGMEPVELKRKYRGRMLFWGAMDTQNVLPRGSVRDVERMVEQRIEEMGEGGGYILAACHNIQPDVPADNIRAMFARAREYVPSFMKG